MLIDIINTRFFNHLFTALIRIVQAKNKMEWTDLVEQNTKLSTQVEKLQQALAEQEILIIKLLERLGYETPHHQDLGIEVAKD